jgi:hypothetical protein
MKGPSYNKEGLFFFGVVWLNSPAPLTGIFRPLAKAAIFRGTLNRWPRAINNQLFVLRSSPLIL